MQSFIIDTREQRPYRFKAPSKVGTIPVGDYTLAGLKDYISIERKTIDDLMKCLTKDRRRFERELSKAQALDYFALVIEASLSDIVQGRYRSKMTPKSVIQTLVAFSIRYRLPIFFAGDRHAGRMLTESLLCKYVREIETASNELIR